MSPRKLLAEVWQGSWTQWFLLVEVCWSLGMARCAVNLLPFRRIAPGLGTHMLESIRGHPHKPGQIVVDRVL